MNTMQTIRKLTPVSLGPHTHGKDFIKLRCHCDFEGHGLASETWEEHWTLELPLVPFHWHSTTGWRLGESDNGMRFHGRTMQAVIDRAVEFLLWFKEPKE